MQIIEVARVILRDEHRRTLILQRSLEDVFGGTWEFPGGEVDGGESLEDAVLREGYQETGLKISNLRKVYRDEGMPYNGKRYPVNYFIAEHKGDVELSDEHIDHTWVEPERLSDYNLAPFMRRLLEIKPNIIES